MLVTNTSVKNWLKIKMLQDAIHEVSCVEMRSTATTTEGRPRRRTRWSSFYLYWELEQTRRFENKGLQMQKADVKRAFEHSTEEDQWSETGLLLSTRRCSCVYISTDSQGYHMFSCINSKYYYISRSKLWLALFVRLVHNSSHADMPSVHFIIGLLMVCTLVALTSAAKGTGKGEKLPYNLKAVVCKLSTARWFSCQDEWRCSCRVIAGRLWQTSMLQTWPRRHTLFQQLMLRHKIYWTFPMNFSSTFLPETKKMHYSHQAISLGVGIRPWASHFDPGRGIFKISP